MSQTFHENSYQSKRSLKLAQVVHLIQNNVSQNNMKLARWLTRLFYNCKEGIRAKMNSKLQQSADKERDLRKR